MNNNGYNNTAVGFDDMYNNTTGASNTAMGGYALNYNTTGTYNTRSATWPGRRLTTAPSPTPPPRQYLRRLQFGPLQVESKQPGHATTGACSTQVKGVCF